MSLKPRRMSRCAIILLGVVVPCSSRATALAQSDPSERAATEKSTGSRLASCIFRIPGDDSIIPLEKDFIDSVMRTSAVRGEAVRSVLGFDGMGLLEVDQIRTELDVIAGPQLTGDNMSPTFFRLTVIVDEVDSYGEPIRPVAEEIQAAVVDRLRRALVQLSEQNAASLRESIARSELRLRLAIQRLEDLRKRRNELSNAAGRMHLVRDDILEEVTRLESHVRELEVDGVSQRARQAAIEAQIARMAEIRTKRAADDAILAELKQLADIQAARLDRVRKLRDESRASDAEVQEVNQSLIEARIRLQERVEMLSEENDARAAKSLNGELAEISIANVESEARIAFIRDRISSLARQLELADQLEVSVGLGLPAALESVRVETEQLQELRSQFETFRPVTVDVVGQLNEDLNPNPSH